MMMMMMRDECILCPICRRCMNVVPNEPMKRYCAVCNRTFSVSSDRKMRLCG